MAWVIQVARNFTSDLEDAGRRFRFLIRDRNTKFTAPFDEVFKAIGMSAIATPVRSPKANAFAERFVRTVREDCLDHLLIYSRRHLESVLGFYIRHYMSLARTADASLHPRCLAMTNHTPARSTGATSSAASSTSTTRLAEAGTPGPRSAFNASPSATIHSLGDAPSASITSYSK